MDHQASANNKFSNLRLPIFDAESQAPKEFAYSWSALGFIAAILGIVLNFLEVYLVFCVSFLSKKARNRTPGPIYVDVNHIPAISRMIMSVVLCGFFVMLMYRPRYLAGKPGQLRLWPIWLKLFSITVCHAYPVFEVIILLFFIWAYSKDDGDRDAFCLKLKPYVTFPTET